MQNSSGSTELWWHATRFATVDLDADQLSAPAHHRAAVSGAHELAAALHWQTAIRSDQPGAQQQIVAKACGHQIVVSRAARSPSPIAAGGRRLGRGQLQPSETSRLLAPAHVHGVVGVVQAVDVPGGGTDRENMRRGLVPVHGGATAKAVL